MKGEKISEFHLKMGNTLHEEKGTVMRRRGENVGVVQIGWSGRH